MRSADGRDRRKLKEADSVSFPKFPKNAAAYPAWFNSVLDRVVSASGRSSAAFRWFMEIESQSITFEQLGIPGEYDGDSWEPLDDKIRSAISQHFEGDLGKYLLRKSEEKRRTEHQLLRGRQIMRLIANWFQTKSSIRQAYGLRELSMVELKEDDLEGFWMEWLKVMSGQKNPEAITPEIKEELFFAQVKKSVRMANDISHYRRLPEGHDDHSYEYLKRCLELHLQETREDKNQAVLESNMLGKSKTSPALATTDTRKPCPFFTKGHCRDGNSCKMAHGKPPGSGGGGKGGKTPGGKAPDGKAPGGKAPGGKGPGGKSGGGSQGGSAPGTPRSEARKKMPCYTFLAGNCKEPCPMGFAHRQLNADEKTGYDAYLSKRAASPAPQTTGKPQVCPAWKKGTCPLGDKCRNQHPNGKASSKTE